MAAMGDLSGSKADAKALNKKGDDAYKAATKACKPMKGAEEKACMNSAKLAHAKSEAKSKGIEQMAAAKNDKDKAKVMDKYNKGLMLGGGIGNAYTQTTIADSAMTMAESGEGSTGMMGLAMGLGAIGGTVSGLTQPTAPAAPAAAASDPVAVLGQLKAMLDQGLITPEQYAAKQQEVLGRM